MSFIKTKQILDENKFEFIQLKSSESTMVDIKSYIDQKDTNITLIAAEQTKGRGRRGSIWISPKGNLYCSIALKNDIPLSEYFFFNTLTSVSIKLALENLGAKEIKFKWPNDIFFGNSKIGGIIIESYNNKKNNNFAIINLGINYLSAPQNLSYKATYIKKFLKIKNLSIFFDTFLKIFFYYWNNYAKTKKYIFDMFSDSLLFLNKNVLIKSENKNFKGIYKGINADGSLILYENKKLINIYSGSIEI